jgi:hypothetical protein
MVTFLTADESHVDLEISYALGRCVFSCPSTKFGVRIPLQTLGQLVATDNRLNLQPAHFDRTTGAFSTCALSLNNLLDTRLHFSTKACLVRTFT